MIEKIVTSLEVSRKLKDLGIVQESCFYWVDRYKHRQYGFYWSIETYERAGELENWSKEKISAFTVTELGAMYGRDGQELLCPIIDDEAHHVMEDIKRGALIICGLNQNLKEWRDK